MYFCTRKACQTPPNLHKIKPENAPISFRRHSDIIPKDHRSLKTRLYKDDEEHNSSILYPQLTTNKEKAGLYCIVNNTQGLSKLQCMNPTNATYAYLHLVSDNKRVVPWLVSSPANNAPSFWYIESTDILTDIQLVNNNALTPNAAITRYDLNGRIIPQPQKGQVYIQRGQKYIK